MEVWVGGIVNVQGYCLVGEISKMKIKEEIDAGMTTNTVTSVKKRMKLKHCRSCIPYYLLAFHLINDIIKHAIITVYSLK